jgi:hypothetical protein
VSPTPANVGDRSLERFVMPYEFKGGSLCTDLGEGLDGDLWPDGSATVSESSTDEMIHLTVSQARRLRDWLNRIIPGDTT